MFIKLLNESLSILGKEHHNTINELILFPHRKTDWVKSTNKQQISGVIEGKKPATFTSELYLPYTRNKICDNPGSFSTVKINRIREDRGPVGNHYYMSVCMKIEKILDIYVNISKI